MMLAHQSHRVQSNWYEKMFRFTRSESFGANTRVRVSIYIDPQRGAIPRASGRANDVK
jgi:hypothetical protein